METCPKIAAPRPAIDGRQPPRLAIEASKLPAYRSLFHLKFELLRLFTLPSVSHRDLVCLVSLVRTFLRTPLELFPQPVYRLRKRSGFVSGHDF
jgi:hypothetical protein